MAELTPFRAVRPRPEVAAKVASVPYDVVDTEEARTLAAGNPLSFLHVVRSEIDLPEGTDPHAAEVYQRAAANFRALLRDGAMVRDPDPALFLYRQIMGEHAQVGLVGCCSVAEYDRDLVKKHEKTRPDKEDDRTRHTLAVGAHCGPVFLTYRGRPTLDERIAAEAAAEPLYDFTAPDGVRHTVWRVADPGPIRREIAAVPALYVADGHHRSASASRAAAALREELGGDGEHERFLAVLFPADQLRILPYNRVVHDLAGASPASFLDRLRAVAAVSEADGAMPADRGEVRMYLGGSWHRVAFPPERVHDPDPVASLDAAILQDLVLAPLLGIDDPRTSSRIDFVGGIRGTDELVRRVERRGDGVAFSLHPVSVEQLMAVADAGRVLPPKSTWFEPKLRSGLLVHEIR